MKLRREVERKRREERSGSGESIGPPTKCSGLTMPALVRTAVADVILYFLVWADCLTYQLSQRV